MIRTAQHHHPEWYLAGAAAPGFHVYGGLGSAEVLEPDADLFTAAAAPAAGNTAARFRMAAYDGGLLLGIRGYPYPVVVDLDSLRFAQRKPVFREHDRLRIVGHTEQIQLQKYRIGAAGIISGVGQDALDVRGSGANGFPWQSSIGVRPGLVGFVSQGEVVRVNARVFKGPVYIARSGALMEISFVSIGANAAATAKVLAAHQMWRKFQANVGNSPRAFQPNVGNSLREFRHDSPSGSPIAPHPHSFSLQG